MPTLYKDAYVNKPVFAFSLGMVDNTGCAYCVEHGSFVEQRFET